MCLCRCTHNSTCHAQSPLNHAGRTFQLYTVVGDRTLADQQLETLRRAGDVLLFKLGSVGEEDTAIMLTSGISPHMRAPRLLRRTQHLHDTTSRQSRTKSHCSCMWCLMMTCNHTDYRELVTTALPTAELAASFLGIATDSSHGLTLTKAELVGVDGIEEEDIKVLLRVGCVAMRDASSFWLSFPRTGVLLQSLRAGREQIVRTVRNTKFKEILQRDLLKRRLKSTGLPIRYLISDAVGRGALTLTHTTSGPLLRIAPGASD